MGNRPLENVYRLSLVPILGWNSNPYLFAPVFPPYQTEALKGEEPGGTTFNSVLCAARDGVGHTTRMSFIFTNTLRS